MITINRIAYGWFYVFLRGVLLNSEQLIKEDITSPLEKAFVCRNFLLAINNCTWSYEFCSIAFKQCHACRFFFFFFNEL